MDEVVEAIEKYQGLVPLVYDAETMALEEARPQDMPYAVYLKREADKVIAEKDAVIAGLKRENKRLEKEASCTFADDCLRLRQTKRKLCHSNYKRCLAIASKCRLRARWFGDNAFYKKEQWALQWHRRWLELAEEPTWAKFLQLIHKEAK